MQKHRPKVLLLGSEAFGGLKRNPAADVVERLSKRSNDAAEIAGAVLPVSFADMPARIIALIAEYDPDVVLGLGLFVGAGCIRVETTAINVADFDVADNQGAFIRSKQIDVSGPSARSATYDAVNLAEILRAHGIPSRVSHHAGTHLCNLMLYTMLGADEDRGRHPLVGFVHFPLLPEQAADLIDADVRANHSTVRVVVEYPSMAFDTQCVAVELIIAELVGASHQVHGVNLARQHAGTKTAESKRRSL